MRHFLKKYLCFIIVVSTFSSAYADIPIRIMPSANNTALSNQNNKTNIQAITQQALIHEHINISNNSPYSSARVQLVQTPSQRYLLVHLTSRYFLSYKIVRINLDANNAIKYPIIKNYQLQKSDFLAQGGNFEISTPQCPAQYQSGTPLFVMGSPSYDPNTHDSVYRAATTVMQALSKNPQYRLVALFGKDATIQNYQNILACPTLKYFFHMGSEDYYGKSFFLYDGDFDASFFSDNPQLNFSNKGISFDTCRAFDQVDQGFCPLITSMPHPPLIYTSGQSELLLFGSAETYACFWKKVIAGETPSKSLLQQCARSHDPSVQGSHSGIYFVNFKSAFNTHFLIQTNQRLINIPSYHYGILKLNKAEQVTRFSITNGDYPTVCTPDPANRLTLLNNPHLNSGEFIIQTSATGTCEFQEISRMFRQGDITRDKYGFYPKNSCFNQPHKPNPGITLKSTIGEADLNCNGYTLPFVNELMWWQTLQSEFNNSPDLNCTFTLNNSKTPIASMQVNIGPSGKYPGVLGGKITHLNGLNGHPIPVVTYAGKNPTGYYYGVKMVVN